MSRGKRSFAALALILGLGLATITSQPLAREVFVPAGASIQPLLDDAKRGSIVVLGSGTHQGFVVDKPLTITGEPGAQILGEIRVESSDVVISGLEIVAARNGITVREVNGVVITDVVIAAPLHGIEVIDGSVFVSGCTVKGLGTYGQGFEIRNSNGRPASVVQNCEVMGGQEGIVSHVSSVHFNSNVVSGTTMAAIVITEMSFGSARDNAISDVTGVGMYCGDMSHCEFIDNRVSAVAPDPLGVKSRAGQGAVVTYHSSLKVAGNSFDTEAPEAIGVLLGSEIIEQSPRLGAVAAAPLDPAPLRLATIAALIVLVLAATVWKLPAPEPIARLA